MVSHSLALAFVALGGLGLGALAESTITTPPSVPTDGMVKRQNGGATTYETTSPLPLTDYFYPYSSIPYQVNPYPVGRGPQSGYNRCNSSTEGPDSECQTAIVNNITDWCLWGSPSTSPNETVGVIEAAVVAYCSRSGYGTRIFAPGSITALQFMRTPGYIQVVGLFNQTTAINLPGSDYGGELDPHGADFAGNPLGGLMYSTGFASGDNTTYVQTQSWNNFIGSNQFCMKLCDPSYNTTQNYCQNIYDILGCDYNAPAAYEPGVFLSCDGDLQDEVGTYTSNGQTYTWSQPSSLPATSTLPWTPRIPASSNCVTYQSTDLFPLSALGYQASSTASTAGAAVTTSGSGFGSGSSSGSATASRSGSSGSGSGSGSSASATSSSKSTSGGSPSARGVGNGWMGAGAILVGGLMGACLLL